MLFKGDRAVSGPNLTYIFMTWSRLFLTIMNIFAIYESLLRRCHKNFSNDLPK